MKFPSRCFLAISLGLVLSTSAFAAIPPLEPIAPIPEIPPLPSLMPADAEPLGKPVDPTDLAEDVDNRTTEPAPAAGSNRGGTTPGAGTDNAQATKPAPGSETAGPNQPGKNVDAKPVKTGLKDKGDNPKGPNEQKSGKGDKGKPSPDSSNRENKKRTPNDPRPDESSEGFNGDEFGPPEEVDNGASSGMKGAGGSNGKQPTGRNNKKDGGAKRNNPGGRNEFPPLTSLDESMEPDFEPAGAPRLPSKCAEDSDCLPCFDQATAAMDAERVKLEKLRSIYDYTHKFTREGTEFLSAAGAAGGGVAQLGAAVEIRKVNGALDSFDMTVHKKSAELLGRLDDSVQQMAECEAKFMDDDTWYSHHGQVYMQFMKGHYSF